MSRLNKESSRPLLCYVTDRRSVSQVKPEDQRQTLLHKMEAAAQAGVDWIQIREKDLPGNDYGLLVREALRRAAEHTEESSCATRILVNDRLDVALAEHASGVHLGEKSLPLAEAKRVAVNRPAGRDFLFGVSCHSLEAARAAAGGGASYLFFGPVFATPSKAMFGTPQGLERLADVCRAVSIPVLAIGGITLANAATCLAAGAAGIAAIRLFQDAPDLSSLVETLQQLKR